MKATATYKIKKGALVFICIILILPVLFENIPFYKVLPLGGEIITVVKPELSYDSWFEGDFQKKKEAYVNQEFGFRNELVRINNQLDYWLFKKANAKGVFYGENGMLFEKDYTEAYFGLNYLGDKKVDSIAQQMKLLQDCLAKDNKTLLMIFAPGKATYFPELVPQHYKAEKKKSNYDGFTETVKKYGINYIDFNKWFLEKKNKSEYPLFPELGIHWSIYGAALSFDSIAKYVEKKRNIDLPDFYIQGMEKPDTLRYPDDDIYRGLNLCTQLPYSKMAYPVIGIKNDSTKQRPTILTVGDSFWWNIYNLGVDREVFKDGKFWFYDWYVYPESFKSPVYRDQVDFGKTIEESDVIVLCYTEATLHKIGNGFLDQLYNYYKNDKKSIHPERDRDINNYINFIKGDKKWMAEIEKRAKETKRSVDDIIYEDAAWQVDNVLYKNK